MLCKQPILVCCCREVCSAPGFVNQKAATVMRDTGCSGVVVKAGYVVSSKYTGHFKNYLLVDGTTRKVSTVIVHFDSPHSNGDVEAMVMPTPIFDVIIRNIPVAKDPVPSC